jgi:hypothetical protein
MGFRRAKFRGRKWIKEQVLKTATVQNIKRMVKMLSRITPREEPVSKGNPFGYGKMQYNPFLFLLRYTQGFTSI